MVRRNIDDLINDLHIGVSKKKKNPEQKTAVVPTSDIPDQSSSKSKNSQEKELYELKNEFLEIQDHKINLDFIPPKEHLTIIKPHLADSENFEMKKLPENLRKTEMNISDMKEAENTGKKIGAGKTPAKPEIKIEIKNEDQKTITEFIKLDDKHEEHKLLQDNHEEIKLLVYEDPQKKEIELKKNEEVKSQEKTKKTFKSEIKKILIIMPRDEMHSVLATPSIKILRKHFPESEIHALINEQSKGVLENNPHLNKVITSNEDQAKQGIMNPLGLYNDKEFLNSLKNENYDAAISLENDRKSIVLTNSIKAKNRIAPKVFGLNFFVNNNVELNEDSHKIEQYLSLISPLMNYKNPANNSDANESNELNQSSKTLSTSSSNKPNSSQLSTEERKVDFFLTEKEVNQAKKLLESYEKPIVCVSCSASTINRQWSQEKWAELLSNMVKFHGAKIIFVGHDMDKEFVKHVIEKMKYKKDVRNLVDKNLRVSAALIAESDLFIGTNSEYLHIARALKTPLIGLFGPDNNKLYGYHEQTYRTIRKHTVCEYCDNPKQLKDLNQSCLKEIDPSEILPIANELLRK